MRFSGKKVLFPLLAVSGLLASVFLVSRSHLYFLHQDHLGNTSMLTDVSGAVVSPQVYYPYGTTRSTAGTLPTERQYTGQISDTDETGLYYYNARYYNPTIPKFT